MNNLEVIIPSAKLVPEELQGIGKLPGIIYPVNQKIVFDYLYKQYHDVCKSMDIVCYEKAEKVCRRLKKYQTDKIKIRILDKLDDLGHTIYAALDNITSPIIINFADTIVFDDICSVEGDTFFYTQDYLSDVWTYYDIQDGRLTKIYDKVSVESDTRKRLFVGVFKIINTKYFKECLENAFQNTNKEMSSFYYAIYLYSCKYPFKDILTQNWFDIGHIDTYYNSKLEVKAREFNHIQIDANRGILTKSSDDKEKFIGEILWYLKLPADVEYVRPRIFSYSTSYINPFVKMEYYAYHTLHELFLYGDLTKHQWIDIFNRIKFVCNDFKRYTVRDNNIRKSLDTMYLKKTLQRFDKMKANEQFQKFFSNTITVNKVVYKSLDEVILQLETIIPDMLYDVDEFNIIHGDLCFANIMVDSNCSFIKVIDPRGKFGDFDIYGDFRYELAKLFHSVDGKYDFIIKDMFSVDYNLDTCEIEYQISDRQREYDLYKIFRNIFSNEIGDDLKKIELIEALLFLSMIPLHGESLNHQMVMLGTGLEILNRVVDIRK